MAVGVEAKRQLTAQLILDVVTVLFGLFPAQRCVFTCALGLDHGQRLAILAEQDIVTELVAFIG